MLAVSQLTNTIYFDDDKGKKTEISTKELLQSVIAMLANKHKVSISNLEIHVATGGDIHVAKYDPKSTYKFKTLEIIEL